MPTSHRGPSWNCTSDSQHRVYINTEDLIIFGNKTSRYDFEQQTFLICQLYLLFQFFSKTSVINKKFTCY